MQRFRVRQSLRSVRKSGRVQLAGSSNHKSEKTGANEDEDAESYRAACARGGCGGAAASGGLRRWEHQHHSRSAHADAQRHWPDHDISRNGERARQRRGAVQRIPRE